MNCNIYDKKTLDSEARNPCPSLVGKDSGPRRAIIAGWHKDVVEQASPSRVTVTEVFKNLRFLEIFEKITSLSDYNISKNSYLKSFKIEMSKKRLSITDAASCEHIIPLNTKTFRIITKCLNFVVTINIWRSISTNIYSYDEYYFIVIIFINKCIYTLQDNSILEITTRERLLETGEIDSHEGSATKANLADITYLSVGSSVNDDFDEVDSDNEAASVFEDALLEIGDNKLEPSGCDLPYNIKRSTAFRRRKAAIKRQLDSDSSGVSTVAAAPVTVLTAELKMAQAQITKKLEGMEPHPLASLPKEIKVKIQKKRKRKIRDVRKKKIKMMKSGPRWSKTRLKLM